MNSRHCLLELPNILIAFNKQLVYGIKIAKETNADKPFIIHVTEFGKKSLFVCILNYLQMCSVLSINSMKPLLNKSEHLISLYI